MRLGVTTQIINYPAKKERKPNCSSFYFIMSLVKEQVADWGNIVGDILRCIADKTYSFQDRVRMGVVCRSWQASLKNEKINFHIFLMLAEKKNSDRRCFNIGATETILELELPEIRGKRCWGTPFGWLVTYSLDLEIELFNPLSRSLWGDGFVSFCKTRRSSRDSNFFYLSLLDDTSLLDDACLLDDVNYINGNFFADRRTGQLILFEDLNGPSPKVVEFAAPPPMDYPDADPDDEKKYIVDWGGHLCMIIRQHYPYKVSYDSGKVERVNLTENFEIFKLDMHTKN
ncbi:hypothetical protein QQP08_005525 [Theobroma cacao]|nr:hypothetical protein QQP08_005525 [Theobroma cacao]